MSDIRNYEPLWGSWHVDSLIGEGSFGKVYKIHKEEFGKTYFSAVKIIAIPQSEAELRQARNDGLDDASLRSYFHAQVTDILQEIDLMSGLRGNSNVVSFEDHKVIEKKDEIAWDILIRMELLTSLNDRMTEKPLTPDEVTKLGIDICKALELCAQRQIIHRDVKPENIFVSDFDEHKLGDFGIARQIERTSSGLSKKGTYTYMAPEVFKGEEYGASVDTYSLGLVMYRLLNANRAPFLPNYPEMITPKDRETSLQRRMRGETIPPPRNGSDALKAAVLRACAFDRSERFASAGEMRKALEAAINAPKRTPDVAYEAIAGQDAQTSFEQTTSATVGVFAGEQAAAHQPEKDSAAGKAAGKPPKQQKKKTGKKLWLLLALCACVLIGLVVLIANLQVRHIDLPEGGILHKGDVLEQEYALSPRRPLINDLQWSSNDESVLAVSEAGEITAAGPGSATLTLSSARGKVSDSITYSVEQRAVSIADLPEDIQLAMGRSIQLKPSIKPADTTDVLMYESEDAEIAKVDADGSVTGLLSGETRVTIQCGSIAREISVTVYMATEAIGGLPVDARLPIGKTMQLHPVLAPEGSEEGIRFSSTDDRVLKVDGDGLVEAMAAGSAVINVTSGMISEPVEIEAYVATKSIEMLPETLRVPLNTTKTLQPVVLPSTSKEKVIYLSEDESIALADQSGNVIGLAVGSTVIRVESDGVYEEVVVEVYLPTETIEGLPESIRLSVGKTMQLDARPMPIDTTDTLSYESGDTSIATVDATGKIKLLREGKTTIRVRSGDAAHEIPIEAYVAAAKIAGLPGRLRVAVGNTARLKPIVLPSTSKEAVKYQSADESIAIADQAGNVTGAAVGVTTVLVECDGVREEVSVEVYIPAEAIEGLPESLRLVKGTIGQLEPVPVPANTTETIVYQSSDPAIVKIRDSGIVEAIGAGMGEVYVLCGEARHTIPVEVYVPAERIEGLPTAIQVEKGQSRVLEPEVMPQEAQEPIQYESMNDGVVTVDANGIVHGIAAGSTSIKVTCGQVARSVSVAVTIPAESIAGLEDEYRIAVGKTLALEAVVYPRDTTDTSVYFGSSNSDVVTIDANGIMTGKKAGKAAVAVSCGEITRSAMVEVYVPATATPKPTATPTPRPTATPTPKPTPIPVSRIDLSASSVTLELGERFSLNAIVSPSNAQHSGITYSTSSADITVSQDGVITAKSYNNWWNGPKTAKVIVEAGGVQETVTVTIKNTYSASWSKQSFTVKNVDQGTTWTIYPLMFENTVPNCTGFTVSYTASSPNSGKDISQIRAGRDWRVFVFDVDHNYWRKVGTVRVTASGVEATASISFNAMNISRVNVFPPTGSAAGSWSENMTISDLRYAK